MKIAGIIAEYNPFHNGHYLHIKQTRTQLGNDTAIVCAMSGNTVQRGNFAAFSKHSRARAALLNGADLVVEIPSPWVLSSAERYAMGAVYILDCIGGIDYLSFGSETNDLSSLTDVAKALLSPEFRTLIKDELSSGVTFASARQSAVSKLSQDSSRILKSPNDILGIEYIKAITVLKSKISPLTIWRTGADHDSHDTYGSIASASYIRNLITENDTSFAQFMPASSFEIAENEIKSGCGLGDISNCETAVLGLLRSLSDDNYAALPDNSEGLSNRFMKYARSGCSIDEILSGTKSKRYTLSRIRRMLMCAYLGIDNSYEHRLPPYIRVLGANSTGISILRSVRNIAKLPIITKPAQSRELDSFCQKVFHLESHITDMYSLAFPSSHPAPCGTEWQTGPVIIK